MRKKTKEFFALKVTRMIYKVHSKMYNRLKESVTVQIPI